MVNKIKIGAIMTEREMPFRVFKVVNVIQNENRPLDPDIYVEWERLGLNKGSSNQNLFLGRCNIKQNNFIW